MKRYLVFLLFILMVPLVTAEVILFEDFENETDDTFPSNFTLTSGSGNWDAESTSPINGSMSLKFKTVSGGTWNFLTHNETVIPADYCFYYTYRTDEAYSQGGINLRTDGDEGYSVIWASEPAASSDVRPHEFSGGVISVSHSADYATDDINAGETGTVRGCIVGTVLYFNTTEGGAAVVGEMNDSTYTGGTVGILGYDDNAGNDITFDNFCIFNGTSVEEHCWDPPAAAATNFTITAKDLFTSVSITAFNATVNGSFMSTTTGTINTGIDQADGFEVDIINLTADFYAVVNFTNTNTSSALEANLTRFYYAGTTHESPVIETEITTLQFQVNVTSDVSDVNAYLEWNGTDYAVTKTGGSEDYNFSVDISIPEVDAATTFNLTWYFNLTTSSVTLFDYNSTQQVVEFGIDNCSVNTFQALNFTLYNETDGSEINGSFAGYMTAYIDSIDESREVNLTWGDAGTFGVCIDPEEVILLSEGQFEYSSTGFDTETYYITNYSLDNSTNYISLYLTDSATQVTFTVTDENDDPVQGAYVHVAKYDLATNSFSVTEIIKTDSSGQAIGNVVLLTDWYKFFIYNNGILELETSPEKLTSTTRNFRISLGTDFYDTYDDVLGVSCALSYTNTTSTFLLTFSDDGGISRQACVDVVSRTGLGDTTINTSCTSSSSGTVTIVHSPTNDTLVASSYIVVGDVNYICGSPVSHTFTRDFETFGGDGIFFVFLIVLTLVMVGIFNPMVSIVLSMLALLGGYFLGLIYLGWGALLAFLLIGILALFRMGRE